MMLNVVLSSQYTIQLVEFLEEATNTKKMEVKNMVLLTTSKKDGRQPTRQQLHKDWSRPRRADNRFFFIINADLDNDAHIYVRGLGKRRILKIRIPANNIFIGRNTLVHAGSETVGMRYHGKLVPIGESEKDVEDEVILFEQDDSYPSVRD